MLRNGLPAENVEDDFVDDFEPGLSLIPVEQRDLSVRTGNPGKCSVALVRLDHNSVLHCRCWGKKFATSESTSTQCRSKQSVPATSIGPVSMSNDVTYCATRRASG